MKSILNSYIQSDEINTKELIYFQVEIIWLYSWESNKKKTDFLNFE